MIRALHRVYIEIIRVHSVGQGLAFMVDSSGFRE